ncbi:MAG: disulfide bond formation protein B [Alphaproteobacteria bacterium]|jgi:disulfide bond formation protein DsbB|nr:disulfide bond formation protein B [Alphaproteobacteria bacterium]
MTFDRVVLAGLLAISLGALALAFWVQYGLGYPPCSLCLRARLPHYALLLAGGLGLGFARPRAGLAAALVALFAAFAISLVHVGVEGGWVALPGGCVAAPGGAGLDDLRTALMAQTRPSCDQPGPEFGGLSMATWHALVALALAVVAATALSRPGRGT